MRKSTLILLGAAAGAAMTLLAMEPGTIFSGSTAKAAIDETYRQLNLFGDVFERVRTDYVEKPDDSKLIEAAIKGMVTGLDPHSDYMDPKSFQDMQVETSGEFGGLGIEVTMEDGLIKVVAPIDETPAAKAGVQANDIITRLDGEQVQGLTLNQAVEKMRGPANTTVKLTIMRKGQDKPIVMSLTREIIRVRSVRSQVEGDDVGYIRMSQVQRADHRRTEESDQRHHGQSEQRQAQGLHPRSPQQSGRLARAGDLSFERVHPKGRDRVHARSQPRRRSALYCQRWGSD